MRPLGSTILAAGLALLASATPAAEPIPGLPGRLRALVQTDQAPEIFALTPNRQPGLERELLEGFCRIHGLALEVVPVSDGERMVQMLLESEGDVITGLLDTGAWRRQVAFTAELFPVRHLAVTRAPRPSPERAEDLRPLRVGVILATSGEKAAVRVGVPEPKQVRCPDLETLVERLRTGEVDAAVMTLLDFALARQRDGALVAGPFVGPFSSAALAVRREDAALLGALNGYLEGVRQARSALMFKYLNEEALSLIALARRE